MSGFADLYRALAGMMSPAEANECELWEIAALLGVDRQSETADPIDRLAQRIEAEKESLGRRAAKLGNVQPQVEGDGPVDITAQVMADMGIRLK